MSIKHKLLVNMLLFVCIASFLLYRELVMMHRGDIPFFSLNL